MVSLVPILGTIPDHSVRREVIHPRQGPQVQYHWGHTRHHRVGNVVYLCTDGQGQDTGDLRKTKGEVVTTPSFTIKHQLTTYLRQMKTVGLGTGENDTHSHSIIISAPLPTRPFNPDGMSEGQRWDERGNAIRWPDESSFETTKHAFQPIAGEGRDPLNRGGDLTTRKYRGAFEHSTGPHMHGREVLVTPFDPRQHLRTRSLSGFHRDATG